MSKNSNIDDDDDMSSLWKAWDEYWKNRRASHLEKANDLHRRIEQQLQSQDIHITKHTDVHWSTMLNGSRVDIWPSGTKFRYKNKTFRGTFQDCINFIIKRMNKEQ